DRVLELHRLRRRRVEPRCEAVRRTRPGDGPRGLADGTVPGAAAEVPAELVVDLPAVAEVAPVASLEQRHHDARRAVAALRTEALRESALRGMVSVAVAQALDGVDALPLQHGEEDEARVHGAVGRLRRRAVGCRDARIEHGDGAGAAVALGTPLLRAG